MLIRADARRLPLADESVDLIVTSPPFYALRSYTDGGEHYAGQIGSEDTPQEWLANLLECTREMVRVLKPSGSIWVDLGDKYANDAKWGGATGGKHVAGLHGATGIGRAKMRTGMPPKSLMLLPERYRIACVDELGLIARAVVVWHKCLSGGTEVYARVGGREKVINIKDLARCPAGTVELWTGEMWSPMLRCDPTPPTEGRAASSAAVRSARYHGRPIPPFAADLEIEFRSGERVGCTPNHKWPTSRGVIRADELVVGDVVSTVRLAAGTAQPSALDDDLTGWLVGLYIAEGSRSQDTVQIASHIRETERFDRLREVAEAFDGRFSLHHTKGNTATANLTGKVILAILDTYVGGRTSGDKRFAPACWRRSDRFLNAALSGYLSGDGHYEAKIDRWVLGFTANDGLAVDLRAVAARLGYSLRLRRAVHQFDGREFPGWHGTLYYDPARRKAPDSEIVAIRQSRARQFWNIEIADAPHEFALASGILTENSNGLPESVTDRVRRSHEDWVHLVKRARYFAAVDEIRQPPANPGKNHGANGAGATAMRARNTSIDKGAAPYAGPNPLGALPGSVWTIPSEPLSVPAHLGVDHFAAMPTEWPRRIILGWSPSGICVECAEGRRPVSKVDYQRRQNNRPGSRTDRNPGNNRNDGAAPFGSSALRLTSITGYACACTPYTEHPGDAPTYKPWREYHFEGWVPALTRPSVVLDPLGGTGTTALVAQALGRIGISVDMSADYCRLARWRLNDPGQRAKAMRVPKPPVVPEDQLQLFDWSRS